MTGHTKPKNKGKGRGNGKKKTPNRGSSSQSKDVDPTQCSTLEEDEMTRCDQPATKGFERCEVHQAQYRTMCKKYKDASEVVDDIKSGRKLPTKEQIQRYTDSHATLDKARWVRKYLESIRVERTGRSIHQRRFFLKVDDGHKTRLKNLAKDMVKAVDTLNDLQARALDLHVANNPSCDWVKPMQSQGDFDDTVEVISTEAIVEEAQRTLSNDPKNSARTVPATKYTRSSAPADEDLIDLEHRAKKAWVLHVFEKLTEPDFILDDSDSTCKPDPSVVCDILRQYARRIIFHEPDLFFKSLDKVSFKDLILDDDFSIEDALKFLFLFEHFRLGFGLMWFKDAVLDALVMSKKGGNNANLGSLSSRHKMLGGWIYNCAHTCTIPNEAWWYLLYILQPPADVENRFVRLCNNFDDMVNFLSFGAIGMLPPSTFCSKQYHGVDAIVSRKHLSLSGVVITDMVSGPMPPHMTGPIQTTRRARMAGCIVWCEVEARGYMFGALRNEPDPFNEAFLRELRARPDLFQVVTRSETDPGRDVETFPTDILPVMRTRHFEAPPALSTNRPTGSGEWVVSRSAVDVLYGTHCEIPGRPNYPFSGYLQILNGGKNKGWFFRYKKFPVKYLVILDTVPNRHHSILARNVAWAALRARGYGEGEYGVLKYAKASDELFQKRAEEILAWTPENWRWQATKIDIDDVNDIDEGGSAGRPEVIQECEGEGVDAYRHGIVLKCTDGMSCRVFPIIITYPADCPEKVSIITAIKKDTGGGQGQETGGGDESEGVCAGWDDEGEGTAEDDEGEIEIEIESEGTDGDDQGKDEGTGGDGNGTKGEGEGEGKEPERTEGKQSERGWGCIVS
ncbi:hypothetical protein DEU56DRAFT_791361 [Suillus clintonianus]|uniref:uncharacterized protein n=1 Tax=Suillus clintonianus TaxID=1904413 RepID=UPI001B86B59F|nr:uncharacterized protein DEU56DRAFT_791361 [Suillus clintonianus]KAG2143575.1 hypothetical protein DEU56DRAFT_791361 [Suillus clintonianus]